MPQSARLDPVPRYAKIRITLLVVWLACAWASSPAIAEPLRIAAASDLRQVLPELIRQFTVETGIHARSSFGASGNLYRQLRSGAPFDLFFSADEAYALQLAEAGLTLDPGKVYGEGRLALFWPNAATATADSNGLDGLRAALRDGRLRRLGIANPEHAPYGRAAREVLRKAGLWQLAQPVLVLGENAAQTAQFAVSGNVDAAIVAHASVLAPRAIAAGRVELLERRWHEPLRQRLVVMRSASTAAVQFYRRLDTEPYQAILRRFGFR